MSTTPTLDTVQGNILSGFNKDHELILALTFGDPGQAKTWVSRMSELVATDPEVAAFNGLFKAVNDRRGGERGVVESVWTQLLLTAAGLEQLGIPVDQIAAVSTPLAQGMGTRADLLGDRQESDPANWIDPFGKNSITALLVIAADDDDDLLHEADRLEDLCSDHDIRIVWREHGGTLPPPLTGHEHFGFKDGISQPPADASELPQFLLGQNTAAQNDPWGNPAPALPAWAQNGSLFVFRILSQDVAGFRGFAAAHATEVGLDPETLEAKLVGRWKSGAPLAKAPTADDPSLATENGFDYSDDTDGVNTPRFAHIRKSNPRAQQPPGAADSASRRILRRGIPYGSPLAVQGATDAEAAADRGLLFLCAQASIEQQFEFIQGKWCNDPNFPQGPDQPAGPYPPVPGAAADGQDPIIGQHHGSGADNFKPANHQLMLQQFVKVRGGEYLIAPSTDGLKALAA
jgi:Dyp-type peroxidase family